MKFISSSGSAFNSLYEIQCDLSYLQKSANITFNSLYEIPLAFMLWGLIPHILSILFMRFIGGSAIYYSFKNNFQFSLWDSSILFLANFSLTLVLSILFMRFWCIKLFIHYIISILSILFMRFNGNFTCWYSINRSFNSLYEIPNKQNKT